MRLTPMRRFVWPGEWHMANVNARRGVAKTAATVAAAVALIGASAMPAAAQTSCTASVGAAQAAIYVRQCVEVSPATHPPCNTSNACALIISEIRRGCALIGAGAPAFCAAYK